MNTKHLLLITLLFASLTCLATDPEAIRQTVLRWNALHNIGDVAHFKNVSSPS